MNRPSTYPSTSAYTVLRSLSEGSVSLGSTYRSSTSWRKFIRTTTHQPESATAVTVIPAARTITEGPTVLKPAPLPEDYDARVEEFLHFLDSFESETETADDVTAE